MINPVTLHNEILNGILDRIPAGHAFHQQMMGNRTAAASRATEMAPEASPTQSTSTSQNNVSFNAILEYMSGGGQGDSLLRQAIETEIESAALRHNIDPNLVRAVIRAESNYRHDVVSHAGAMGLMQLMPGTAASLGVTDPFDIRQNIDGGTMYLRRMLDMFDNDLSLALAAYNAGQGNVRRHGGIPPFRETMNYVPRVKQYFENYALAQYRVAAEDSRL